MRSQAELEGGAATALSALLEVAEEPGSEAWEAALARLLGVRELELGGGLLAAAARAFAGERVGYGGCCGGVEACCDTVSLCSLVAASGSRSPTTNRPRPGPAWPYD